MPKLQNFDPEQEHECEVAESFDVLHCDRLRDGEENDVHVCLGGLAGFVPINPAGSLMAKSSL